MGGGGKNKGGIGGAVTGLVKGGAKVMSAGMYNPDTGGVTLDPKKMGENWVSGYTHNDTLKGIAGEMPELPDAPDLLKQEDDAEKAAALAYQKEVNGVKAGLASTLLGGSLSSDSSILKKKKLLGE